MSAAYVDTSAVVAIAFGEPQGRDISGLLAGVDRLISSNLLEAELGSAFAREGMGFPPRLVSRIDWVFPERPLTGELATALDAGYLRAAALWHVAISTRLNTRRDTAVATATRLPTPASSTGSQ